MSDILSSLQPKEVFHYFEEISKIPRGSGDEKRISDYMVEFAKSLGLEVKQDEVYNIYIKKPATSGYENIPGVILQGHLDMVCEKNNSTNHDFTKEGLDLYIEEDWIKAKGTTLGADNGIAIAYQMAVLADSTLKHPQIECLMTTDEERGMTGVKNLHPEYLSGKILLNLDSDAEGEFFLSCAGGAKTSFTIPTVKSEINSEMEVYKVAIKGLKGGHSGAEIHLERANAHILMGRVLNNLRSELSFELVDIMGGSKDNVITRECEVIIAISPKDKGILESRIKSLIEVFKLEYKSQEPDLNMEISLQSQDVRYSVISKESLNKLIDLLIVIPNGVMGYDINMKGLVQTSLNLGVLSLEDNHIELGSAVRSSMGTKKQELINKLQILTSAMGIEFEVKGDYPEWQYNPSSRIRECAEKLYKEMYGKEAVMTAIHAGLECGFISEKISGLDMISFGPNVKDIHSPKEAASISSMARVYEYLVKLLENLVAY